MNKQEFLENIRKQIHFVFDRDSIEQEFNQHIEDSIADLISEGYSKEEAERIAVERMGNPIEIGKQLNEEHHPLLGYLLNPYSLLIIVAVTLLTGFVILGSAHSGNYYSSPEREVEQLSTEYYLGPTINENNDKISNIRYYEVLDGVTESASPIGYYVLFDYKENEIDCEILLHSNPSGKYEGDLKNSNIYLYKDHKIYLWDFLDEELNLVTRSSKAVIGDYICSVEIPLINPNDVNFDYYNEIMINFMSELVDDYITNNY